MLLFKLFIILSMHGTSFEITEQAVGVSLTLLYSTNIAFNISISLG